MFAHLNNTKRRIQHVTKKKPHIHWNRDKINYGLFVVEVSLEVSILYLDLFSLLEMFSLHMIEFK